MEKNVSMPAANDDVSPKKQTLTGHLADRPDAREIREFLTSYLAVDDPVARRQIFNAVQEAATLK